MRALDIMKYVMFVGLGGIVGTIVGFLALRLTGEPASVNSCGFLGAVSAPLMYRYVQKHKK